jgi:hypothetical protein
LDGDVIGITRADADNEYFSHGVRLSLCSIARETARQ